MIDKNDFKYLKCMSCPRLVPFPKDTDTKHMRVFCVRCTSVCEFYDTTSRVRRWWWKITGQYRQRYIERMREFCQCCHKMKPAVEFADHQAGDGREVPRCLECDG